MERRVPILLHGHIAAAWLERDGEIPNPRVIEAVPLPHHRHEWYERRVKGRLLADKLEPRKVKRRPNLKEVLQLAKVDIDMALLEYVNRHIVRQVERGDLVHPRMLEFAMSLL